MTREAVSAILLAEGLLAYGQSPKFCFLFDKPLGLQPGGLLLSALKQGDNTFLDKMVYPFYRAMPMARRLWRQEMYCTSFLRQMPLAACTAANKTV